METIDWKAEQLSRLMLGTVQFGLPYGVANQAGQPSPESVREIVQTAIDGGVNCFDTAAGYGTSEEVLGQVFSDLGVGKRLFVVTKTRQLNEEESASETLARAAIIDSVEQSRKKLRLEVIPMVLFHRESERKYLPVLDELKNRGWIKYFGVSCDNRPAIASELAESSDVHALQIPANALDSRHLNPITLRNARSRQVALFVRSIYLQGLILMKEADVPNHLDGVLPYLRTLTQIAAGAGISNAELAMRYILAQPVTCVLTGVETLQQLKDNLQLVSRGPLTVDLVEAIEQASPSIDERLITPSMWIEK